MSFFSTCHPVLSLHSDVMKHNRSFVRTRANTRSGTSQVLITASSHRFTHRQIWRGICSPAWGSGRTGGNLEQSLSRPRLGGWSDDPEKIGAEGEWDGWRDEKEEGERERERGRNPTFERIAAPRLITPLSHWLLKAIKWPSQHFKVMQLRHLSTHKYSTPHRTCCKALKSVLSKAGCKNSAKEKNEAVLWYSGALN